jgi:hypothetical protein
MIKTAVQSRESVSAFHAQTSANEYADEYKYSQH